MPAKPAARMAALRVPWPRFTSEFWRCSLPMKLSHLLGVCCLTWSVAWRVHPLQAADPRPKLNTGVRVGAASAEFQADDSMIIAGGITAGKATGQEGKLRAVAVVLEKQPFGRLAIVACDVLMITRQHLDPVSAEIEKTTGIPSANILINCTHTHHAPSTTIVHGYGLDEIFTKRVQRGIVSAVQEANANLSKADCRFYFHLGAEATVGQNSRMLLADGMIYWVGPRDNFVRPTGPFDPELPVLAFRDPAEKLRALIFNHSTHSIGTRQPGRRSPSFYGLAAQELEGELGGTVCFLEGASGSTHNLSLSTDEMIQRIKTAVRATLNQAEPRPVTRLTASKRPFKFRVRIFDEAAEAEAVRSYCRKAMGDYADRCIEVFRLQREKLAPHRGEERETWLHSQECRTRRACPDSISGWVAKRLGLREFCHP